MNGLYDRIREAVDFIRSRTNFQAERGIVLGTGLSGLTEALDVETAIPYADIPHCKTTSAPAHPDQLIFGSLKDVPVIVMSGRLHYYEGYSMEEVTFPIRMLGMLGVDALLISNATGATNQEYKKGELVVVEDHINLHSANPLRGENDERLGERFPDMSEPYNPNFIDWAVDYLESSGFPGHAGTYFGWQGPNLETPAEYAFIHRMGGDVVGMSTVPEVIVARHMNLEVLVLSVVTNVCYPKKRIEKTSVEDVIDVAEESAPHLQALAADWLRVEF